MGKDRVKFLETDKAIYEIEIFETREGFTGDVYINNRFYNMWVGESEKTRESLLLRLAEVFSKQTFPPVWMNLARFKGDGIIKPNN